MLNERVAAVARRLRERGYRFTPQRMAIVQAILESRNHPSAEEIYRQVSAVFPMISLATVYKTLEVLKDIGEIAELSVGGRTRYDGNPQPHIHLVCERCHSVTDWGGRYGLDPGGSPRSLRFPFALLPPGGPRTVPALSGGEQD
jgi:Fur family peroxide stress response transcriptional regulator